MLYDKKWEQKPEVEPESWRSVLLNAATYIRGHGWCQGSLQDPSGRVCLWGAIALATKCQDTPANSLAKTKIIEWIGGSIVKWNDDPNQTERNVINTLEAVARKGE